MRALFIGTLSAHLPHNLKISFQPRHALCESVMEYIDQPVSSPGLLAFLDASVESCSTLCTLRLARLLGPRGPSDSPMVAKRSTTLSQP